jgi:hypothetical protein
MGSQREISNAVKAFFTGLIDYAGLYPPAALGLTEAMMNYRTYGCTADSWILSRFIAGAAHVLQLSGELLAGFSTEKPLSISLVTKDPAQDLVSVLAALPATAAVAAVEVPLVLDQAFEVQLASHAGVVQRLADSGHTLDIFYEVPFTEKWDEEFLRFVDRLGTASRAYPEGLLGCKLRCGGLEPHLVPSPERLGRALHACAERSIPVKFTAGLHQPFRHMPQPGETGSAGVPMHGYWNVYWAALVASLRSVKVDEVVSIVAEMDSCNLSVSDDSITWRGVSLSTEEIQVARSSKVLSFGSCSFDEPIHAARMVGWL